MRVNVWVTLNPPEPEVDTGVSMQMCSSELSYSVLRCTPGHVRQARRYDCYEGLVVRWWCIGALWVVRWRHLANLSFHRVGVAGANGIVVEFALGNAVCVR